MEVAAQKDRGIKNGFRMNFQLGIPSIDYGATDGANVLVNSPGTSFGFDLGNYFYFGKVADDKLGIGMAVNWFGMNFSAKPLYSGTNNFFIEFQFCGVGPLLTFSPVENMGIDVSFQVKPTIFVAGYSDFDRTYTGGGLTFSNLIAFRYKVLFVGIEPNFGKIKSSEVDNLDQIKRKLNAGQFKFLLGLKF